MSAISLTQAHQQFEAALPAIDSTLSYQFRHLPRDRRAEAIGDARAAAWAAWHGLVRRGQDPLAVGVSGIAFNATRYVKAGRKLGCGAVGRAAIDVYDRRAGLRLAGSGSRGLSASRFRTGRSHWSTRGHCACPVLHPGVHL